MSRSGRSTRERVRCGGGFTLIELLVVIAIIALLMAILMPALGAAKNAALFTVCMTRQHGFGKALQLYAGDHDGWIPRDGMGGWRAFTFPLLATYVGATPAEPNEWEWTDNRFWENYLRPIKLYKCPAIKEQEPVLHFIINGVDFQSFESGGVWQETHREPAGFTNLWSQIPRPADCAATMEVRIDWDDPNNFSRRGVYSYDHWYFYPRGGGYATSEDKIRVIRPRDQRHQGKTTLAFFDGHGEALDLEPEALPLRMLNPLIPGDWTR
ncbi:MAG: type II secretion system protein [Phycisphaerae bacterium]